jgi:hypothetical protein
LGIGEITAMVPWAARKWRSASASQALSPIRLPGVAVLARRWRAPWMSWG